MRKRVGITTDPEQRRKDWEKEYPTLRDWNIVKRELTYEEAQALENVYKSTKEYEGHEGGPPKAGRVYSVYTFSY